MLYSEEVGNKEEQKKAKQKGIERSAKFTFFFLGVMMDNNFFLLRCNVCNEEFENWRQLKEHADNPPEVHVPK